MTHEPTTDGNGSGNAAAVLSELEAGHATIASVDSLAGVAGAPLPGRSGAVVIGGSSALRGRFFTARARDSITQFEGSEHTYLGDNATLKFDSGSGHASAYPLTLANGLKLTYGQIVALAGDFYGVEPISDDPKRFGPAFDTLCKDKKAATEAPKILDVMKTEIDKVNEALKNGREPSTVYPDFEDDLNGKWNVITGGGWKDVSPMFPPGRYLKLALINWDHFGQNAISCYTTGHRYAMQLAVGAGKLKDPSARTQALQVAYAANAFADHFLTDLFSAGHLRTPRKELFFLDPSFFWAGSYLAKFMHDEDCKHGLNVRNARGDKWTAYGDKRLRDAANEDNLKIAQSAVQQSVNEIWEAFQTQAIPQSTALTYVPDLSPFKDPRDRSNPAALFIVANGVVQVRTKPANRRDYSWGPVFHVMVTLIELARTPELKEPGESPIPPALATDVLQLWDNGGKLGIIRYGILPDGRFGEKWANPNLGQRSAAVQWLAVDANGDGRTDIVQIFPSGNSLGMTVYAAQVADNSYKAVWTVATTAPAPALARALAVDMDGDGKTEIAQVWNYGGRLAMRVWSPQPDCSYRATWSNWDLGPLGEQRTRWVVVDMHGDGKSEIVAADPSPAGFNLSVYSPQADGGYRLGWLGSFSGDGMGQWDTWQAADLDGDGRSEILHAWLPPNNLWAMSVYAPQSDGSYKRAWTNPTANQIRKTVAWLVVDVDGDGHDEVLQLWDNSGHLAMTVYRWQASGSSLVQAWQTTNIGAGSAALAWLKTDAGLRESDIVFQMWNSSGMLGLIAYEPRHDGSYRLAGKINSLGHHAVRVFLTTAYRRDVAPPIKTAVDVALVDADGAPLHVPEDMRIALLCHGAPVATGEPRGEGTYHFDGEVHGSELAVRLEPANR